MPAVPSFAFAGLTIPPAAALNSVARPRPLAAAGARSLVPLTYGEDRVAALVLNVLISGTDANTLLVQCLWGHACSQIDELRLNDEALPAGSTVTSYIGTQGTPDAALVAAFAAQGITYTDTLAGYAYSVVAMPVKAFDGQLAFSARIRGRKLYDPRLDSTVAGGSGAHRLADPATWAYSDNPALALADWLYSSTYGAGEAVVWTSAQTAADASDAMIGTPAEKRRLLGLTLAAPASVQAVAETLRAYAGCWLVPTAAGVKLLPDADAASAASYSHASGQIAAIEPLARADLGNVPTAVEIVYTDTTQIPWRDASATAQLAGAGSTLPWRLSTVQMPGIQRHSQALREATERLNKLTLIDLGTTLEVFDSGIAHEIGDIVTVTHPLGLSAQAFRVAGIEMPGPGRWRLSLREHDAAVYSNDVTGATPPTDTPRTAPAGPPDNVAGLTGSVAYGIITWAWTASTASDYAETRLRVGGTDWASATPLWNGRATAYPQQVTAAGAVTVRARHVGRTGVESTATASYTVTVTSGDLGGGPAGPQGPAGADGADGAPGADGAKTATPTVYKWAISIPTIVGTGTYTWATASVGTPPSGWTDTPGTGTPGQTLWGATVPLLATASATTSPIDWTLAGISARGYAGADGAPGPMGPAGATGATGATGAAGTAARRAYVLTTSGTLGSGTVTTTGSSSLPPSSSVFGSGLTWAATPSTPAAGQYLFQSDGLYNPATNQIDWETPYISALKVGNLSAISANMGTITAGNITLDSSGFIKGGSTAFNTGDGFWLGYHSANWKLSIKYGSSSIVLDPSATLPITFTGQVFGSMALSGVTDIGGSIASGSNKLLGTRTASVAGGTGTIAYQWYLSWSRNTPSSLQLYLTGARTASCSVYALSAAAADETDAELVCVATDANGRTAVAACGVGVVFT